MPRTESGVDVADTVNGAERLFFKIGGARPTYDRSVSRKDGVRVLLTLLSDFHLVDLLIRQEMEARGIETFSLGLLNILQNDGPMTPTALGTETGLPPTTIRRWTDELVRRGQLRKNAHPTDKRSYTLEVTAKGVRAIAHGAPALEGAVESVEAQLGWKLDEIDGRLTELKLALQRALGYGAAAGPDDRRRFWVDEDPPRTAN